MVRVLTLSVTGSARLVVRTRLYSVGATSSPADAAGAGYAAGSSAWQEQEQKEALTCIGLNPVSGMNSAWQTWRHQLSG
ncbi:hypothetical protein EJ02DRAFT_458147 [Clathrospora elynae]|uniref:Uncharacterized protein n=1 Tax=Clathrospora elynae TaxID=706981 RepID=A0A6A5SEY2_9PLEO|nr:hypothetical protein EJ02DRAFT_458147 [Clathrospora elynae]